jgi:hypothetical protein
VAPELKKGVKMMMHHSRDTAHKQWSETRVLTLRGLLRTLKASLSQLPAKKGLTETWESAARLCENAVLIPGDELEVSVAAIEVVFGMLKAVSDFHAVFEKSELANVFVVIIQTIWSHIGRISCVASGVVELASQVMNKTADFYHAIKKDSYALNCSISYVIDVVIILSSEGAEVSSLDNKLSRDQSILRGQLRAAITALLSDIHQSLPAFETLLAEKVSRPCFDGSAGIYVKEDACHMLMNMIGADDSIAMLVTAQFLHIKCMGLFSKRLKAVNYPELGVIPELFLKQLRPSLKLLHERVQESVGVVPTNVLPEDSAESSSILLSYDDCIENILLVSALQKSINALLKDPSGKLVETLDSVLVIAACFLGNVVFCNIPSTEDWICSQMLPLVAQVVKALR